MKKTTDLSSLWSLAAAAVLLLAAPLGADPGKDQDWPLWSGPERNMTSNGNGVFETESFGLEVAWTREIGSAYAGIVVADGKVITGFAEGESDFMGAFSGADGSELWRYRIGEIYAGHDGSDDGPIATPTIHDGTVYGLGAWGELFAISLADGQKIWAQKIVDAYGARKPRYGFTTTPTVIAGKLIVQMGGENGSSLAAFDPANGEKLWSTGDDMVGYQSPMSMEIGGHEQIVAVSDVHISGFDPKNGDLLWQVENDAGRGHGFSQPVPIGDDGFLLGYFPGNKLYRVRHGDDGYEVEQSWESRHLRGTYAVAAPYGDHLYGLAGRFLTCVDAKSGEMVWKSRPPGGWNLVLVDGHLVIQSQQGEIVVAEATPEGYHEKARVKALDRGYYTRPSFASGRIFVRNLTTLTAVGVTDAPAQVADAPSATDDDLKGLMGEFVRDLRQAKDKAAKVDAFLAEHPTSPILDGESLVHFVYRGDEPDLALSGAVNADGNDRVMHRVAGTDFWFFSRELPPASYFTYSFAVYDEGRPDPRNPRKLDSGRGGEISAFGTRGFEHPRYLEEPTGERGSLDKFTWKSKIMDNEREVQVYLPAGYDDGDSRHPLLVHHHGDRALGGSAIVNILDNLSGETIEPLIVAFVGRRSGAEYGGADAARYVEALADELVPYLDEHYRTRKDAASRAAWGPGSAGTLSVYSAAARPDVFGHAGAVSFYWSGLEEEVSTAITAKKDSSAEFFVQWSLFDYAPPNFPDAVGGSKAVVEKLRAAGLEVEANEVGHVYGWTGGWQLAAASMLESFFPKPE